ncbi:MAG TPA: hypothetical protein PLV01_03550 [Candidatus Kapabacteria bacterium]|nr:hypothetical protein [Candidatus Kapabacteria bacterium]HPU23977.1 hypothetical protein [Candidatus Kapabacteria bacterium]
MKSIAKIVIMMLILGFISINAQQISENFQTFYSDIQRVLSKETESLTQKDIEFLNATIQLNPNFFGNANQKLTLKAIQDAKNKKAEYETWLRNKQHLEATKQKLDETSVELKESIARGDSLYAENVQLKELIEQLTKRVKFLEREATHLQKVNKNLKEENIQTKYVLEQSKLAVQRIMRLLPKNTQDNELFSQVPATLQDSLSQSECQIAELIMNNFLITLEKVEKDQMFLDSARIYYKENKVHLAEVEGYISQANELINKFRELNTSCTNSYASQIEGAITDLRNMIEMGDASFGEKIAIFVAENLLILIIFVVLIGVIIFLLVQNRKKDKSQNEK